jgi:WD40 repeat protein
VLYTLCAGRPPFRADTTAAMLQQVGTDRPTPLREVRPDVPGWLCDVIARLQALEVRDRLASAQEVADLLGKQLALLQQPPIAPTPDRPRVAEKTSPGPPSRRGRLLLAGLIALLVVLAALAVWLKPWRHLAPDAESDGKGQPGAAPRRGVKVPAEPLELRCADIPPRLLALAGGGDPAQAPPELAAVLGDGRFLLPRIGQTAWMDQGPDGKVLAVPLDEDVVLFEARTGTYLRTLKGPGGRVFSVTFSRDGALLAATTRQEAVGGAVRAWDLQAERVLYTHPQPGPTISCAAAFSPDGKYLVTEVGGRIHVREARSGKKVQDLEVSPKGIAGLGFSPDGRRLAVTTWYGCEVKILEWAGDRLVEIHTLRYPWPTTAAVYSPDGKFLVSSDVTGFKLWNAQTFKELRTVEAEAQQLAFTPDGRTLLAATTIDQARAVYTFTRWDAATWKALPALAVAVAAAPVRTFHCLSRDGQVLFVAPQHGATYVKAIDTATGKELFPRLGHAAPLNAVAVSPDGRTVASAGEDWVVKVWDPATGAVRHALRAHTGAVCGLAFSPDGTLLASGSRDGTIALWDVDGETEVRALHGHARSFSRIQFSPDGKTLAAGGEAGNVKFWDVASGKERRPLPGHKGVVRCVAFSPDGSLLASGGEDRTVRLHRLGSEETQTFPVPQAVNDLAFSPDSRTLAAVGDGAGAAVHLWDLLTGAQTTWTGHSGSIQGLAFSPTAPLLATCGEDGTVRLWDRRAGGGAVRTLGPGPFGGGVGAVAFTPDGRYLATANANGTVYLLRLAAPPSGIP